MREALALEGRLDVPQPGSRVPAGRGDLLAIGMKAHAPDLLGVSLEDGFRLAARQVPDAHGLVEPTGSRVPAVDANSDALDLVRVSFELLEFADGADRRFFCRSFQPSGDQFDAAQLLGAIPAGETEQGFLIPVTRP